MLIWANKDACLLRELTVSYFDTWSVTHCACDCRLANRISLQVAKMIFFNMILADRLH